MEQSKGKLSAHRLFGLKDLGLPNPEPYVDKVVRIFLAIGEAVAARWIEMPKGVLLLQMVPNDPASGAIYLYDRTDEHFYMMSFEGADDTLTREEFEGLLPEYELLRYAEEPTLLRGVLDTASA